MQKPTVYILCGFPFSGKTTLAKGLVNRSHFAFVGIDEINTERGVGQSTGVAVTPEEWKATYKLAYKRIEKLLDKKKDIIYDATNFTRQQRDEIKQLAQKHKAKSKIIFVDIPKEEAKKRWQENRKSGNRFDVRDEDFAQVIDNFQRPTKDEDILVYDQARNLQQWISKNFTSN